MYPEMVRELFDVVPVGMPIRIEYETVKLGRDPETGAIVVASFPDVYHLSEPRRAAASLFRKAGMSVTLAEITRLTSPGSGLAVATESVAAGR